MTIEPSSPDRGKHGSPPTPDPIAPNSAEPAELHMPVGGLDVHCERSFLVDDVEWVAFISGSGAYGTGHWGLAALQTVHFARASAPDVPLFESLVPANQFAGLFDNELLQLFRNATRIVIPEGGPAAAPRRFSLSDDL